jgi:hypothetical protein
MSGRQMKPPPSVPANVDGENCIYLTSSSAQEPFKGQRLSNDARVSVVKGRDPMKPKDRGIVWA